MATFGEYPIFGQTYRFLHVCSQHSRPPARTAQPWSSAAPPVKNRVWNGKPTMLEAMSKGVGEFQRKILNHFKNVQTLLSFNSSCGDIERSPVHIPWLMTLQNKLDSSSTTVFCSHLDTGKARIWHDLIKCEWLWRGFASWIVLGCLAKTNTKTPGSKLASLLASLPSVMGHQWSPPQGHPHAGHVLRRTEMALLLW